MAGGSALTPWNEARVAIAELRDICGFIDYAKRTGDAAGALKLIAPAVARATASVERACSALEPNDANND